MPAGQVAEAAGAEVLLAGVLVDEPDTQVLRRR